MWTAAHFFEYLFSAKREMTQCQRTVSVSFNLSGFSVKLDKKFIKGHPILEHGPLFFTVTKAVGQNKLRSDDAEILTRQCFWEVQIV